MSHKAEMKMEATFHAYGECIADDCGWEMGQSTTTRNAAKRHTTLTGHRVRVVVEKITIYGPKDT